MRTKNGVDCWRCSPSKYVQEYLQKYEHNLKKKYDLYLTQKVVLPFPKDYRPDLSIKPEFGIFSAIYYNSYIGILLWIDELDRVDIITEVSMLYSHLAFPRQVKLEIIIKICAYLKCKHNSVMAFEPSYRDIDTNDFKV